MDIRNQLLLDNSQANALLIVNYIGNNTERFDDFMKLFLQTHYRVTQRASLVLNIIAKQKFEILEPYLEQLLLLLESKTEIGITRNIVRMLQFIDIPEELLGLAFDKCYHLAALRETPTAVKSFSISILYNICKKEPDLKNEVTELVQMQLLGASSGLKNRSLKVLKALDKL